MNQHEPKNRLEQFGRDVVIGSLTGMGEVTINQPLICIKNTLQQRKPLSINPHILYRGFGVNVSCMAPTTALQIATNKALEEVIVGNDTGTMTMRAFTAGIFSALASSPTELVVIHQQNEGLNAYTTIQKLIQQKGLSVMGRGCIAKSLREGGFGIGLLAMYPSLKNNIYTRLNNESAAIIAAGIIAGTTTAIITHPFDTISTAMQVDYTKQHHTTMCKTAQHIYNMHGVNGFFRGVAPRGTRIGLAIPLMHFLQHYLHDVIDKK
jgi:hypothetical protein